MNESNSNDRLDAKHECNRERRIESIKRWVEYIKAEPPETWGPQQNAIIDAQLDAAQSVETSAAHKQHVKDVAAEIRDLSDDADDQSA